MQKILIIGCGRVAHHYKLISKKIFSNKNKVIGVVDLDLNKAKEFANFFNCNYYLDYNQAIKKEIPNLIIILTPSGSHYQIGMDCLKRGINTVVEKPMAMTPHECRRLIKLSNKKNILFSTIFQNRFNPSVVYVNNLIKKGHFGKIVTANVRLRWARYQSYYNDGWHGTWKNDGGVLNQQCIHHIDILNMINGQIKEVCAYSLNALNKLEAEDTMTAIFNFKNNSTGTLEATTAARPKDIEASLSVVAEGGYFEIAGIALNKIKSLYLVKKNLNIKEITKKYSENVPSGYGLSHINFFNILFKNLNNNLSISPVDNNSALETTKIIHALYKSNEKRSWIKVDNKSISNKLGL
tara:strand:+ start:325 stop:1380 length:1056 start_codon:yes stop_codon:yes gene_type:complete